MGRRSSAFVRKDTETGDPRYVVTGVSSSCPSCSGRPRQAARLPIPSLTEGWLSSRHVCDSSISLSIEEVLR